MFSALLHLLAHTWANLLVRLGTTTTSVIVFSVLGPILIFILCQLPNALHQPNRRLGTTVRALAASLLDWSTLAAPVLTLLIWISLFIWSLVATIYDDHQNMKHALSASEKQAENLQAAARAAQNEISRQTSINGDLRHRPRENRVTNSVQPSLETVTVRLLDKFEFTVSAVKPVTMQTDTINVGSGPAYNVIVQQEAVTESDWRFDWKNVTERRAEMLPANTGKLTTTSIAPLADLRGKLDTFPATYIYGSVSWEEHTGQGSKRHAYTYCYSLFSWRQPKDDSEVSGKFIECPKQPTPPPGRLQRTPGNLSTKIFVDNYELLRIFFGHGKERPATAFRR